MLEGDLQALYQTIWLGAEKLQREVQTDPDLTKIFSAIQKNDNACTRCTWEHGKLFYKGR